MKELEDYNWFPSALRNFQTEFIGFVVVRFNVYDAFVQHLKSLSLPELPMVDLCSGSGEPAISIFRKCNCFSHITLSDKYPDPFHFHNDKITYETQPTDVLKMDFKPDVYYTMFNAFHHFGDDEKLNLVQKIQASGATAFFVEILEPKLFCLLKVLFLTTIGNLVLTPFIRPFSLARLFFTYVIPVNFFTITIDGIISVFKSRSVKQYQILFARPGNSINIFKLKKRSNTLIILQIKPEK